MDAYSSPASDLSRAVPIPARDGAVYYVVAMSADRILLAMRNGNFNASNFDGSQQTLIAGADRGIVFADACHDGKHIVYAAGAAGKTEAWRMDEDGTNAVQLTHTRAASVCVLRAGQPVRDVLHRFGARLLARGIDGGAPVKFTLPNSVSPVARISPDGKLIFYSAGDAHEAATPDKLTVIRSRADLRFFRAPRWWELPASRCLRGRRMGRRLTSGDARRRGEYLAPADRWRGSEAAHEFYDARITQFRVVARRQDALHCAWLAHHGHRAAADYSQAVAWRRLSSLRV